MWLIIICSVTGYILINQTCQVLRHIADCATVSITVVQQTDIDRRLDRDVNGDLDQGWELTAELRVREWYV